jgi:hypothetical protein
LIKRIQANDQLAIWLCNVSIMISGRRSTLVASVVAVQNAAVNGDVDLIRPSCRDCYARLTPVCACMAANRRYCLPFIDMGLRRICSIRLDFPNQDRNNGYAATFCGTCRRSLSPREVYMRYHLRLLICDKHSTRSCMNPNSACLSSMATVTTS